MSPSEEEEDNRVAVIKYESERGDGGEREREERGFLQVFPSPDGGREPTGTAQGTGNASSGAGAAVSFQQVEE